MKSVVTSVLTDASKRDATTVEAELRHKAEVAAPWYNAESV